MTWIRVEDGMPLGNVDVLFTDGKKVYFGMRYYGNLWCDKAQKDRDGEYRDVFDVTHWAKLPSLPNDR